MHGARALIERGETVTVTRAAALNGISKATAYRYYSDAQTLSIEAALSVQTRAFSDVVAGAETTREKVCAVSAYIVDLALENEPAHRQYLARVLDASVADKGAAVSLRRGQRITMFEEALKDAHDTLLPDEFIEVVYALSAATGIEAVIALRDIVGVNTDTTRETVLIIANAILDRYLGPEKPNGRTR
ncbi:hypothetical protein COL8621_01656 [Actibacterium lipolyticum]|uniref:TetR family transcriptional regulator n=1 Tax=Actibacterium lipolyticum TaxID=1524263 RepID=A0A238JYC2_9RHOB|nr:hypothetical protein COL8621_01656 [Actibacterium lipolyticum]